MIEAQKICYQYPGGEDAALQDVSVSFPRDSISAIIGESGSGKTTMMMCLGQFIRPQQGRILYDGTDIFDIPENEYRKKLGMVFQRLYLFPHLTVLENMILAVVHTGAEEHKTAEVEAEQMLTRLGIGDILERYPSQISGGQAQRAAIARGLLLKPDYMLLDEPTSALDARTTDDFASWLRKLKNQTNFIIVTHDILFAKKVSDRGVCLMNGKIAGEGPIEEVIKHLRQ